MVGKTKDRERKPSLSGMDRPLTSLLRTGAKKNSAQPQVLHRIGATGKSDGISPGILLDKEIVLGCTVCNTREEKWLDFRA
jgi:hypothetical protein